MSNRIPMTALMPAHYAHPVADVEIQPLPETDPPSIASLIFLLAFPSLLVSTAFLGAGGDGSSTRSAQVCSTVDPNQAPWWELSALPEIGEATALAIVRHRSVQTNGPADAHPVFSDAEELERVKGIGPKTVQRIAPQLRFSPDCRPGSGSNHAP